MTVLLRRFHASALVALVLSTLVLFSGTRLFAQSGANAPDRIVSPVRTDLPGRTVWAFATTGTGSAITTFAATDKGLYKSSGGAWSLTSLDKQSVYAVKSRRVGNITTLLVGTDKGVLRSSDGGNTWASPEVTTGTAIATSNVVSLKKVFDIEVVGTNWFVATEKGVYRSTNDGRTWALVNIDRTADNNEVRGITVDGNTIIVNLWKEGLWRSTNNGNSWTKLSIAGETALCRAIHAQQGTNATVWLAGSVSGNIWRSVNNGTSWTRVYQTMNVSRRVSATSVLQAGIDAFTGEGSTIFASTPGGIAYSRSYGQTWAHTRTTTPQAVSMAMLGRQVFVGFENASSPSVAMKEMSSLTSGSEGVGQYTGSCPADLTLGSDGCAAGGGGGGGSGGGGTIIPPSPSISNITPNPGQRANAPITITITGSNLLGSQVRIFPASDPTSWQLLSTTSMSGTQIIATVPAALANVVESYRIQLVVGSVIIITQETLISEPFTWNVVAPNPILSSVTTNPPSVVVGQSSTLTLIGSDFADNAVVRLYGPDGQPTTLTPQRPNTSSQLVVPLSPLFAAVSYSVDALNPGNLIPSERRSFIVTNPQITLGTPTLSIPAVAGLPVTVSLGGTGFLSGVTQIAVSLNGVQSSGTATILSGTNLTFAFTPALGGVYSMSVQNSGTSAVNTSFVIQTPPPTPTVFSLTQNGTPLPSVVVGSGAQTIIVNGSGFQADTKVRLTVNGVSEDLTPSAWTSSQITVTVVADKFSTAQRTLSLAAYTPPLSGVGGGVSASSLSLHVVLPVPQLNSITPTDVPAGNPTLRLAINAEGVVAGQTLVRWAAGRDTLLLTLQTDGAGSFASVANSLLHYPTLATVRLINPAWQTVGGGVSAPRTFLVKNSTPRLDSVTPRSYTWLGAEQSVQLSIVGANFNPSTKLVLNGVTRAPLPQNITPTSITYTVTFNDVGFTPPGALSVRVLNPSPGSTESDLYSARTDTFRIVNPAPIIYTFAQQAVITQLPSSIVLSGASFLPGVTADIAGVAADVVYTNGNTNTITIGLNAAVQARLLALGTGVHYVTVRNLPPAAAETRLPLTVVNPGIITLTVTPNPQTLTAPPSAQLVTLTALSSGAPPYIATNASVTFRGQTFPFASRPSQSQLTVTIPASLLDAAGSFPITVTNPPVQGAGGGSQSAAWQLNNPRPVVTSMTSNPTSALAGTDVVLTLDGSAFVPAAAVVWRGNTYTPTSNTGNRIVVTIPAAALDSAGSFAVIVRNPSGGGDAVNQPALTVLAPRPLLNPLGQQTLTIGANNGQPLVLNMGGSGFVRGSRFVWNVLGAQSSITTTYTNSNNLTATIPANLLTQAGIYRVAVVNDPFNGQGGGVSDTLTFTVTNPRASLNGVTPQLLPRFANSADLTFTGSSFVTGARLLVTGLNNVTDTLTTHVQSATQLTATLPAPLLDSAVTLTLRVLNPAPTDGVSTQVNANVVNPRPRLLALSQISTLTGLPLLVLTANGNQFMDGAVGYANGTPMQTVVNNTGSLTLTVPASALAVAGTVLITVQNPLPRVQPDVSDTLQLTVNNPLPVLDSATSIITVSTQATTVQLYGANFILASSVKENGGGRTESTLSSNRLSQTQMTATVPATLMDVAGTLRLTVENPTPGGGSSQSVNVAVVHPVPAAQRVTPSVVTMSANDVNVVITGDRFVNTAEILVNGQTVTVTQRTPTRLTATIPAALLATRGAYNVIVRNPATVGNDGGTSATLTLTVTTPQPLVTTINLNGSPNQVPLDTVDVPLTVNGSRFHDSAMVRIVPPSGGTGTIVATQNILGNQITALIPASVLTVGGVYSVVVENLAPTDAPSLPVTFAVVNPVPQMDSIAPKVVVGMTTPQTITVFGQKFTPTSVVRWRGQNLVTTFVNRNTLTAVLPPALQIRGAVGTVTVFTPTDGVVLNGTPLGGGIGSAPGLAGVLTVTHGVPALTATAPANLLRDAWSASALPSLTLNGNLIASTANVRVQSTGTMNPVDTTLTPTSVNVNGLSLVVTMPRSVVVTAGTFTLTITNPPAFPSASYANDGGTSASVNLTVQNPTPVLGSLAPLALAAASPNTLLTVNGTNLTRETQVFVNGVLAPRTIVSATQFTTTLPASLFTLSGIVRVQALNPTPSVSGAPAGDSSNALSLEVFNPVPTLTTANPVFAPIGGRAAADSVTITLVGTNFVRNSQARIAATAAGSPTTDLPTTFVATTTLTVRMLPADFRAQAYNMTVFNPTPRGGVSAARRFTVTNPLPVLTALLPNSTTASGKVWTLRTVGNFFTATSQVSYNKVLQSLTNTTYIPNALTPSTQDTLLVKLAAVPVGDTTFPVVVVNPPTGGVGGGASDTLRLAVGLPAPTITSLSPATTTATLGDNNRSWTLTVNGTLFDDAAEVLVNGVAVPTSFVSTTRLRAVLPDALQSAQARRTVQVRNTPVLLSNLTTLTVQNPAPVLTTLTPSTITAGRDTTITLTGDRFAPDATVRLTYGTTNTILTPSARDSVIGLTVTIPGALTRVKGAYALRVSNPALQPTMIPSDTLTLGGGLSAAQILSVDAGKVASVEYMGVDTLLYTGDRMPLITLRFRDNVGNLVDNDPVTLNYINLDSTVIYGSFPVTRLSLGQYRADTLRFPTAGRYVLAVDTTYSGALHTIGQNHFTVLTRGAVRVELSALQTTLQAGDTLPSFRLAYFDTQNNPTDVTIRPVVVTAIVQGIAYRDTLTITRQQTGVYQTIAKAYPGAALYTVTPLGISAANITGERTFTVTPRPAASVLFTGVLPTLTSGGLQARFRATLRDTYNNLTDNVQQDSTTIVQLAQVTVSMSTDATVSDSTRQANASAFTMQRTSLGVFTADVHAAFTEAGNYALGVQGIASTTGTSAFTVRPNVDYRIVFENVPDTLIAGDSLRNVIVRYFDRNDNLTDNSLGRVLYARTGGSSTASVALTRLETGVYAVNSTQATIAGTYNLSVSGISSLFMEGNRRFVLRPNVPIEAALTLSTSSMTARGATVNMTLRFYDTFGNPSPFDGEVIADNQQLVSTATVNTIAQSTVGLYTARLTVLEPGSYALTAKRGTTPLNIRGTSDFGINPGRAVRAVFDNVPASVLVGSPIRGVAVQFIDGLGAPTNHWYGDAIISGPETKPVLFNRRDEFGLAHSGWYDLDSSTVVNSVGRHTFVVYDSARVELRMSAVRSVNVVALPQTAEITFGTLNPDSTANAGAALPITVRFRDTLGNIADVLTPVRLLASTSAFIPTFENSSLVRVLTRSLVGGVPQFTTTVTPSTAGTYRFALEPLPAINRAPNVGGRNPLVVIPALPRTVEIALSAPSVLMNTGELCATLTYRDAAGNLADIQSGGVGSSLSFQYASGSIASTGTIVVAAQQRQSQGVYQVCGLRFAQANINPAHTYALFVQGITVGNTRGQRTFQVLNPVPELTGLSRTQFLIDSCGNTGLAIMALEKGAASMLSSSVSTGSPQPAPPTSPEVLPSPNNHREPLSSFMLYSAAPNPFSEETKIRYELADDAYITLTIMDMQGNRMNHIAALQQNAGYYELIWTPPASLPSGTYFVLLTARTAAGTSVQRGVAVQRIK